MRYFNGEAIVTMTDVAGALPGFSHTRSYSNKLASMYPGPNGNNWLIPNWPCLVQETPLGGLDETVVFIQGQNRVWFDLDGTTWTARYGAADRYAISYDSGSDVYTMTFSQDERDIITQNSYDPATGLMTTRQVDVDAGPAGESWTVKAGDHFNVTTTYEYDDLGRQILMLGQSHGANPGGTTQSTIQHATWTVYKEAVSGDQAWVGRGYREGSADTLVNPVSITVSDKNGRPTDQIQATRTTGSGALGGDDKFLYTGWSRWTVNAYNDAGQMIYQRVYHDLPTQAAGSDLDDLADLDPGTGGASGNYVETHYGYDPNTNLRVRVLTPGGTVTRTVYDGINRVSQTWVGLDADDGGANWADWNWQSPGTGMKKVSENVYDGGSAGGNSNLTLVKQWADDNTVRETGYAYDFRSRQTSTTDPIGRVSVPTYDNLSRVTETKQYGGDPATGTLIGQQESFFNDRGQVYKTQQYAVNPSSGSVGNALIGETWYDDAGNVLTAIAPGSGEVFTKNTYDNLGRTVRSYTGYEASGGGDVIIAEQETTYNKVNQVLDTTSMQRDTDTPSGSRAFLRPPVNASPSCRSATRCHDGRFSAGRVDRSAADSGQGACTTFRVGQGRQRAIDRPVPSDLVSG